MVWYVPDGVVCTGGLVCTRSVEAEAQIEVRVRMAVVMVATITWWLGGYDGG